MSEVLTEKPVEIAETIAAERVESSTETNGHGQAHLADGTLLEEMKKAVKQSALDCSVQTHTKPLTHLFFLFLLNFMSKKVEFYFADANLPYDKCTNVLVLTFLSVLNELFFFLSQVYVDIILKRPGALDPDSDCCIFQTDAPI